MLCCDCVVGCRAEQCRAELGEKGCLGKGRKRELYLINLLPGVSCVETGEGYG